jgi:tetratricopeptide (TPR) repeat protein
MDETIGRLTYSLIEKYNRYFANYPKYFLDLSWPSIGILDMLTRGLRGKSELTQQEEVLVLACSSYIGVIVDAAWQQFPGGFKSELVFVNENPPSVYLRGHGGQCLHGGQKISINISEALRSILRNFPEPLKFFENTTRTVSSERNILSLFASGLACGLSPYATGTDVNGAFYSGWSDKSAEDLTPNIHMAEAFLSKNAALYYRRNFPSEALGQNPDLYCANLIFPPAGCREIFPCCRTATSLGRYLVANNIQLSDCAQLAENLGASPDDLISSAGFCLSCAISDEQINPSAYNLGYMMDDYKPALRPAVILLRKILGHPDDFATLTGPEHGNESVALARIDQQLGLIPLFRLPYEFLHYEEFRPIINSLAFGEAEQVLGVLEALFFEQMSNIELLLQQAHLYLRLGMLDDAEQALRLAEKAERISEPFNYSNFLELGGILHMGKGEADRAIPILEKCLGHTGPGHPCFKSAATLLCWSLATKGRVEQALQWIERILHDVPHMIDLRVLRLAMMDVKNHEDLEQEIKHLARVVPMSFAVFESVLELEKGSNAE